MVLLKSQQGGDQRPPSAPAPHASQPPFGLGTSTSASDAPSEAGPPSAQTAMSTPQSLTSNGCDLSPAEAEGCFLLFRDEMLPHSPILYLPPTLTAAQLREERPFLWLTIMSISLRVFPQQTTVSEEVRATLAQKLLVEHERNLDLLQGLLVYMTWYVPNLHLLTLSFPALLSLLLVLILLAKGPSTLEGTNPSCPCSPTSRYHSSATLVSTEPQQRRGASLFAGRWRLKTPPSSSHPAPRPETRQGRYWRAST